MEGGRIVTISDQQIAIERKMAYMNMCRTKGWPPNDKGLLAFVQQIESGLRDKKGQMNWGRT